MRVAEGSPRPMDDSHYTEERGVGHQLIIIHSIRVHHANSTMPVGASNIAEMWYAIIGAPLVGGKEIKRNED